MKRRSIIAAAAATGLGGSLTAGPALFAAFNEDAAAHQYTGPCDDDAELRYTNNRRYHFYSGTLLSQRSIDAIRHAANNIRNDTEFNWQESGAVEGVRWDRMFGADTTALGRAQWNVSCQLESVHDVHAFLHQDNLSGSGEPNTLKDYRCTAIHEFGHALALRHQNDEKSIMNQPHDPRCHDFEIDSVTEHDISDINYKY